MSCIVLIRIYMRSRHKLTDWHATFSVANGKEMFGFILSPFRHVG